MRLLRVAYSFLRAVTRFRDTWESGNSMMIMHQAVCLVLHVLHPLDERWRSPAAPCESGSGWFQFLSNPLNSDQETFHLNFHGMRDMYKDKFSEEEELFVNFFLVCSIRSANVGNRICYLIHCCSKELSS